VQLQVDRVEKQVHDVVGIQPPAAARLAVSLPGVLADPRDSARGRDLLLKDLLQRPGELQLSASINGTARIEDNRASIGIGGLGGA
jgi:hypothetical protein